MKYYYEFENEEILSEGIDIPVSFNDLVKVCNVIKTNKNILFFEDMTKDSALKASGRTNLLPEYKLIHQEVLADVSISFDGDNTIITTKDNNEIILNGYNL